MCGLAGFSGTKNFNHEKIKFLLFWNSVERGKDATGVFTPKSGIVKDNIEAKYFINRTSLTSKVSLDTTLIGHVRAKTVGANSADNAHPFEYGNIVMAHNGTLENHLALCRMYNLKFSDLGVDSKVLASCLAANLELDEKFTVLEQYEGAAALLFYNKITGSLYTYHDNKRPLFYGYYAGTEMYISSIKETLEAINCTDIKEFEVDTLHEIRLGQIVSKTKYISNRKSNFLETILADIKDLTYKYKKNKFIVRSKKQNISGLAYAAQKSEYLKGFWVMCDTSNHVTYQGYYSKDRAVPKNINLLVYGDWYFVLGTPAGEEYKNSDYIEVKNSKGEKIICTTTKFNLREFIPQTSKYVVLLHKYTFTKTKEVLGDANQMMIVKDYDYGVQDILLENPETGVVGTVETASVRIATKPEVMKYLEECAKACDIVFPEVKEVESKNKEDVDPKDLLENIQNSTSDKEVFESSNSFYSYVTVCNIIAELQHGIGEITSLISDGRVADAIVAIKEYENDLSQLYDPSLLDQFIPDDEYIQDDEEEFVDANIIED